jgi:hypothetical protein
MVTWSPRALVPSCFCCRTWTLMRSVDTFSFVVVVVVVVFLLLRILIVTFDLKEISLSCYLFVCSISLFQLNESSRSIMVKICVSSHLQWYLVDRNGH